MKIQLHFALPVTIPLVAALALPLGSCNATSGAAAGALLGAGLGQMAGGDTEATIMGAVLGAGIGAAIGWNVEKKREARVIASREATRAELEAANQAAAAVSASSRVQAIARARAYEAEHADEYKNPAPKRVIPVNSVLTGAAGAAAGSSPEVNDPSTSGGFTQNVGSGSDTTETPASADGTGEMAADTAAETAIREVVETTLDPVQAPAPVIEGELAPVLVEVVPLPSGGVVLKDLETGTFIDNEVHEVDQIQDVSNGARQPVPQAEAEEPIPFTLILSDKKTGKTREYTAIYSA